jgi:hypothetical protein
MTAFEWLNSPATPGGKMNLKEKITQAGQARYLANAPTRRKTYFAPVNAWEEYRERWNPFSGAQSRVHGLQ